MQLYNEISTYHLPMPIILAFRLNNRLHNAVRGSKYMPTSMYRDSGPVALGSLRVGKYLMSRTGNCKAAYSLSSPGILVRKLGIQLCSLSSNYLLPIDTTCISTEYIDKLCSILYSTYSL